MITNERKILLNSVHFLSIKLPNSGFNFFYKNPILLLSIPLLSKTWLEGCILRYINLSIQPKSSAGLMS